LVDDDGEVAQNIVKCRERLIDYTELYLSSKIQGCHYGCWQELDEIAVEARKKVQVP